mgnify:CR=1 FL=1
MQFRSKLRAPRRVQLGHKDCRGVRRLGAESPRGHRIAADRRPRDVCRPSRVDGDGAPDLVLGFSDMQGDICRELVKAGERLPIPSDTPMEFAVLIRKCWAQVPEDRPTFRDIIKTIRPFLSGTFL